MSKQDTNEIINPILEINKKETMAIYKRAMKESGWEPPLWFKVYEQVRFFEDYGKYDGSVAGVEKLAEQFGVTPKQILKTFDNLTNVHKLGCWVVSPDKPFYRRQTKQWRSYTFQERLGSQALPPLKSPQVLPAE